MHTQASQNHKRGKSTRHVKERDPSQSSKTVLTPTIARKQKSKVQQRKTTNPNGPPSSQTSSSVFPAIVYTSYTPCSSQFKSYQPNHLHQSQSPRSISLHYDQVKKEDVETKQNRNTIDPELCHWETKQRTKKRLTEVQWSSEPKHTPWNFKQKEEDMRFKRNWYEKIKGGTSTGSPCKKHRKCQSKEKRKKENRNHRCWKGKKPNHSISWPAHRSPQPRQTFPEFW